MRIIVAALVIGFSLSPAFAAVKSPDLSIGGVAVGATEREVIRQLGTPLRRVDSGDGIDLHYPGMVVSVGWDENPKPGRERHVVALLGTGAKACTPQGLCPGQPVAKATKIYGPTEVTHRETGDFLEYQPVDAYCWLQISAPSGVIRSLAVECQP